MKSRMERREVTTTAIRMATWPLPGEGGGEEGGGGRGVGSLSEM